MRPHLALPLLLQLAPELGILCAERLHPLLQPLLILNLPSPAAVRRQAAGGSQPRRSLRLSLKAIHMLPAGATEPCNAMQSSTPYSSQGTGAGPASTLPRHTADLEAAALLRFLANRRWRRRSSASGIAATSPSSLFLRFARVLAGRRCAPCSRTAAGRGSTPDHTWAKPGLELWLAL